MLFVRSRWILIIFLVLILLLMSNYVYAEAEASAIQTITEKIKETTGKWHDALRPAMLKIFWTLATISLGYNLLKMAIKGSDLPDILLEFCTTVLIVGFWLYIINHSYEFANAIVLSLGKAANIAAGVDMDISPGQILDRGLELAGEMIESASGIGKKIVFGICCILVVMLYCFIAAIVFIMLIEVFIVTGMSIILLGFSGSPWTSEISKKYFIFTFSIGIKLFATVMVVRFGEELVRQTFTIASSYKQIFAIVGVVFLIAYLTKRIPEMAQSLISGVSSSSPADVQGMAAVTGRAVAAGVMGAMGASAALYQAHKAAMAGSAETASATQAAASISGDSLDTSAYNAAGSTDNDPSALPSGSQDGGGKEAEATSAALSADSTPTDGASVDNESTDSASADNAPTDSASADNTPTDSASAGNTPTDSASPNTSYTPVVQPLEVNNAPQVEKNESPKGLGGYVKRFAAAYARGTKDSIAEKISNSPHFDTARKIRENSLSDQISKKKE